MAPEAQPRWRAFIGRAWRIVPPRWSAYPLSGDGAAAHGGRFNAKGVKALYLALDHTTAFAEYQQEFGVRPGAFYAYRIAARRIVDLADDETLAALSLKMPDLSSPWKAVSLIGNAVPLTVALSSRLISQGAEGAFYQSGRFPSGLNMVIWKWNVRGGAKITVHDPAGDLERP